MRTNFLLYKKHHFPIYVNIHRICIKIIIYIMLKSFENSGFHIRNFAVDWGLLKFESIRTGLKTCVLIANSTAK